MSKIRAVFFDLGSTLLYSKLPWEPIYEQANQALIKTLRQAGIAIADGAFSRNVNTFLDSYYSEPTTGTTEKTTFSLLKDILFQMGFQGVPDSVLRSALDALYAITQQNWYLENDAIPTLEALLRQGYRLGIISNTSDDKNVQQLVDRNGLRPYFGTILTSAGCGIRKPDERIFRLALENLHVSPEQSVMVGDMLEADILGANLIGMYSIWITRRVILPEEGELKIQPQAVVTALYQIPALLTEIENEAV